MILICRLAVFYGRISAWMIPKLPISEWCAALFARLQSPLVLAYGGRASSGFYARNTGGLSYLGSQSETLPPWKRRGWAMKIETMQQAEKIALGAMLNGSYKYTRTREEWGRIYLVFRAGIMRRYTRLQQENASLRDEVAFWKAEALKDGGDE
jgi:hypothetical protein